VADESNGASGSPESGSSSGSRDQPTTSVTFRTQHGVAYGETVKVVGDSDYLGAWEIAAAPGALNFGARISSYSACSLQAKVCAVMLSAVLGCHRAFVQLSCAYIEGSASCLHLCPSCCL